MHIIATVAGWVGAVVVLSGYGLVVSKRMAATDLRYLLANIVGAAGLALSAVSLHAWQSATVNVLWFVFGVGPLVTTLVARRAAARTADQAPRAVQVDDESLEFAPAA